MGLVRTMMNHGQKYESWLEVSCASELLVLSISYNQIRYHPVLLDPAQVYQIIQIRSFTRFSILGPNSIVLVRISIFTCKPVLHGLATSSSSRPGFDAISSQFLIILSDRCNQCQLTAHPFFFFFFYSRNIDFEIHIRSPQTGFLYSTTPDLKKKTFLNNQVR